jgi:hypothetical protein
VEELVTKLQKSDLGVPNASGEWSWLNENHRKNYVEALYSGNWKKLQTLLSDPLHPETAYGMITPITLTEKLNESLDTNNFATDLELFCSLYPRENLELLKHESLLPHPFSKYTESLMTYSDSPRHAHFAKILIDKVAPNQIGVEIGGGYGGLVYFLKKFGFRNQLINCDLLESLLVAYVFLNFNGIKTVLCLTREDLLLAVGGDSEVILITPNLFDSIADLDEIGFVFNSRSLSEMSSLTCSNYLRIINLKIMPEFFVSENAEELIFPESERHLEITQDEISKLLTNMQLTENLRTRFMGGSNRYTLRTYKRFN